MTSCPQEFNWFSFFTLGGSREEKSDACLTWQTVVTSKYCNIIYQKKVLRPLISLWTLWISKRENPILWARQLRIRKSFLIHVEYTGSGVRTSSYAFWLIPAHHTSSGSRACWLTQNPNTQVTSHCWTSREVNGNLNTFSGSRWDFAHPITASKSWSLSRSFCLSLSRSEERTSQAHAADWNLACCEKLGKGPRPWKVTSHYLRPHFSLCTSLSFQDKGGPLATAPEEERTEGKWAPKIQKVQWHLQRVFTYLSSVNPRNANEAKLFPPFADERMKAQVFRNSPKRTQELGDAPAIAGARGMAGRVASPGRGAPSSWQILQSLTTMFQGPLPHPH